MAEVFQAADGIGLVIGGRRCNSPPPFLTSPGWRDGKFFFIGRADNAYLRKLKITHCAVTLSAEPRQTAWR
jgi:hypothetical protein